MFWPDPSIRRYFRSKSGSALLKCYFFGTDVFRNIRNSFVNSRIGRIGTELEIGVNYERSGYISKFYLIWNAGNW